jgi:hypothetical protein
MLARGMENLHPQLSELPLGSLTAEHTSSDSCSVEGGEKLCESFPLRLLAIQPEFAGRTFLLT